MINGRAAKVVFLLLSLSQIALSQGKVDLKRAPADEVRIVGYNDMEPMLNGMRSLFLRIHPDSTIRMWLPGTATGAGALTLGTSTLAPMGAEFSSRELQAYRSLVGGDPVQVRVAHCSLNPAARSAPIGIYVNVTNPLAQLTVDQVSRIFTSGLPGGDLTTWSQLTSDKVLAGKPIHACGIAEEAAAGISPYMLAKMGGHPYTPTYSAFGQSRDAVRCVAEDPLAIAFASANIPEPRTKLVAIANGPSGPFQKPTSESVASGDYAFDRYLYVYARKLPGEPIAPITKEYLRLLLSEEGQRVISAAPPGYLPLNPSEVATELKHLELQ